MKYSREAKEIKETRPLPHEILLLLGQVQRNDPNLTTLDIKKDGLLDHHVEMICTVLGKNTHVTCLRLIGNHRSALPSELSANACHQLAALKIDKIIIIAHWIKDPAAIELAKATYIKYIEIYKCYLLLESVAPFLQNKSFHEFKISFNIFPPRLKEIAEFEAKMRKVCERNQKNWKLGVQDALLYENQLRKMTASTEKSIAQDNVAALAQLILVLPRGENTEINGKKLLLLCVEKNAVNCIRFLLKSGVFLDQVDGNFPALTMAATTGKAEIVKVLLPYSTSMTGELYSDFKSSLVIVASKVVELAAGFFEGHQRRLSSLEATLQKIAGNILSFWKTFIRNSKDLRYKYPMLVQVLLNNIKTQSPEEHEAAQIMQSYSTIYRLLRIKRGIITGKHCMDVGDYYDVIQCSTREYQIERPVLISVNSLLPKVIIEKAIDNLNRQLHVTNELEINWDEFPKLFVLKVRSVQYQSAELTAVQMEDHLKSCHLNRFSRESAIMMESSLPSEALRHGYVSLKFTASGQPVQKTLGKIFVGLFSPAQLALYRMSHVGKVEGQASRFTTTMNEDAFFFESVVDVPDFSQLWTDELGRIYMERFNIDLFKFKYYRDGLKSPMNNSSVSKELIENLIQYQSKKLFNLALAESKRRFGYLIFKWNDREYGLSPINSNALNIHHQQMITPEMRQIQKLCDQQYLIEFDEGSQSLSPPTKRGRLHVARNRFVIEGPGYWYTVQDGICLLRNIRSQLSFIDDTREDGLHPFRQNTQNIFLADPYHHSNFSDYLKHDILHITALGPFYSTSPWSHMPTLIIIPILSGTHWVCVKIQLDYANKRVFILWNDPFGENAMIKVNQKQFTDSILQGCLVLMQYQTKSSELTIEKIHFNEEIDVIDQQGYGINASDSGVINFTNIADYISERSPTIPCHDFQHHAQIIQQQRKRDARMIEGYMLDDEISTQRISQLESDQDNYRLSRLSETYQSPTDQQIMKIIQDWDSASIDSFFGYCDIYRSLEWAYSACQSDMNAETRTLQESPSL